MIFNRRLIPTNRLSRTLILCLLISACNAEPGPETAELIQPIRRPRQIPVEPLAFGDWQVLGTLTDPLLSDTTGLSTDRTGRLLWMIRADRPTLYAVDWHARQRKAIPLQLQKNVNLQSLARFTSADRSLLLIIDVEQPADHMHPTLLKVHVFNEPTDLTGTTAPLQPVRQLQLTDPTHTPFRCHAMAVDPNTGHLLLAEHQELGNTHLYLFPGLAEDQNRQMPIWSGPVTIPAVTGMSIDSAGRHLMIGTWFNAYQYTRQNQQSWQQALAGQPDPIKLPDRRRGETISFSENDRALLLTSQGQQARLWMLPTLSP